MIELERNDNVFVMRMNAGENRIGPEFVEAFGRALDEVEQCGDRVALVTTGLGKFYSNGLDIEGLSNQPDGWQTFLDDLHRLFGRLLSFPAPTVAAINGHAFAGGWMLAVAHDVRVMRADRGFVCLPEIDMATGQPLTPAMVALLRARLPGPVLHELLVTGRRVGGEEAATLQIVSEALPEDEVLDRAIEIARERGSKDPATLGALKRGLYADALAVLAGSN